MRVIADLHGGDIDDPVARAEFNEIKEKVLFERQTGEGRSYAMMWRKYKQRVLLAMSSQAFAQLNGINVISYYAPRVFEQAGWRGRQAILMTGVNAIIYVLSTLPPWYLVDRWGRRPILLSGASVMGVALCATGFWMSLDVPWTPNAVVVCVIIYNAAFGYSWGPIPWLYPPEIMPLTVRAKGVSLSTCTNWAFNYIVGAGTPWLQDVIHWRLYFMHAFFCACSFMLVYFLYPETKGIPLEEMDAVFGEEKGDEEVPLTSERSTFPPVTHSNPGAYPPKPPSFNGSNKSWLSRLFQPKAREGSSYRPITNEELAPLHHGDHHDDGDGDGEYEMLENTTQRP